MLGLVIAGNICDGVRVLGIGRHLLLFPDRLLHRAQERLERRQQGVHRQSRRRFRHDHRPDGSVGQPGHVCLRRHRWADRHLSQRAAGRERLQAHRARWHGRSWPPCDEIAAGIDATRRADQRLATARRYGYWLLVVAGLGIFCGCVGKSAQFPLHVWLPDAMEGPTPVSALVHSATMVAAGVYLVGRFYPVFTPEVLLVIAYHRRITLFLAATIAITAVDIKRVLAYSTVSQLGYMMLALGVGGWVAGLFHLITHAFFKSLLFMCSGSVIHAATPTTCGRWAACGRKCPGPAYTMLVGCLAIIGGGHSVFDRPQRLLLEGLDHRAGAVVLATTTRRMALLFYSPRPAARRSPRSTCSACGT